MKYCTVVLTVLVIKNLLIAAYPFGAPTFACNSMRPVHLLFRAQSTESPFATQPEKPVVDNESSLNLTLYSLDSDTTFKGYMLMAYEEDSYEPIGSFVASANGKIQSCSGGFQNMATHGDSEPKLLDIVTWLPPPEFEGKVIFQTTFVKGFRTFWVKTPSAPVYVVRKA